MKYIIRIFMSAIGFTALLPSCIEDKGNYDYNWVQSLELRIPEIEPSDSIVVTNASLLQLTPVFYDTNTGEAVTVDYDDYVFTWDALPYNRIYESDKVHLSDEYNLNANIVLPIQAEYHTVTVRAVNTATTQVYIKTFHLRVTGLFESAYFFLTEDSERNVEMDIYGWTPEGEEIVLQNYFGILGLTQMGGGANAITFDKYRNSIFFATGDYFSWLDSPSFEHYEVSTIETILVPTTQHTFDAMIRLGGTGVESTSKNIICFGADGSVHDLCNLFSMTINYANINGEPTVLSPMVAGYQPQMASVYWSQTHKTLCWADLQSTGSAQPPTSVIAIDAGTGTALEDCVYMGGSTDREMITVVRDVTGEYWRVDLLSDLEISININFIAKIADNSPRRLVGTAQLGTIDHWINSHARGYIYAIAGGTIYSYVESQAGDVADPGWTAATITDSNNVPVTITDPISFTHFENDGRSCMYVFTYSAASGGTLYMLRPRSVGTDLELVDRITGLGNAKKMCYWWG